MLLLPARRLLPAADPEPVVILDVLAGGLQVAAVKGRLGLSEGGHRVYLDALVLFADADVGSAGPCYRSCRRRATRAPVFAGGGYAG